MDETRTARDEGAPTEVEATTGAPPRLQRLGRFEILAKLGAGGMGDVYRAYDPVLERNVALKLLRTTRDADGAQRRRRMIREARAAAALTHPNTVTIYEVGEADGEVFLAMELLEGQSLRTAILDTAPLERRLTWLLHAARALRAAHDRGLVHRDVKPENIFVCASGVVKLLDFGIAKRGGGHSGPLALTGVEREQPPPSSLRTGTGRQVGTPRYMAPEQRAGAPTDARTDQYSWGLVAFEILTGSRADSVATASMANAATGTAPSPDDARIETLARFLPSHPEVVAIVERALRSTQDQRFPSMAPIVDGLEHALTKDTSIGAAVAMTSPPPAARPRPRRRGAFLFGAVLAVAALAATVLHFAPRLRRPASPSPELAQPAFAVVGIHEAPALPRAPVALLPGGDAVIGRHDAEDAPFRFERISAQPGSIQEIQVGGPNELTEDVLLQGLAFEGVAGIVAANHRAGMGTSLFVWREDASTGLAAVSHIPAMVFGAAATSIGDRTFVATVQSGQKTSFTLLLSQVGAPKSIVLAEGDALSAPALAHDDTHLGIAHSTEHDIRFDLVDDDTHRIGDSVIVAKVAASPAVAFLNDGIAVLWVAEVGGITRLWSAWRAADAEAFSAPIEASPGAAFVMRPVVARIPGAWIALWVAIDRGHEVVRVGRIGPKGVVIGPTDVADAERVSALFATAGKDTIDIAWADEATAALRIARLEAKRAR